MSHLYDVIIIGGGPAGYSAALYSARAGLETLVIEKFSIGGQMTLTDVIDNYPGFEEGIDGISLGFKMQQGAERYGAKTEYDEILEVSLDGKTKSVKGAANEYKSKAVIIATGANPRELGIDGEQELVGKGVHYCAHCDGRFYKDKVVAIIGGANSAIQNAIFLSSICKEIHLVFIKEDLDCENALKDILNTKKNIKKYPKSTVTKLIGDPLSKIEINNKEEIEVDGVFVSIGMDANTSLVKDLLDLNSYNYIVSEDCLTNKKGIFVAGDCRSKKIRQVTTATGDGTVAAIQAIKYLEK